MKEIKELMTFISFSFQTYIMNLLVHFAYLFIVTAVTVPVFFIGYNVFHNHYLYYAFLFLLVIGNFFIRRFLVRRNQLYLNAQYIDYLYHHERGNSGDRGNSFPPHDTSSFPPNAPNAREITGTVRSILSKQGVRMVSLKLILALAAMEINNRENREKENPATPSIDQVQWSHLKTIPRAYQFFQLGIFLALLIPFMLISFLITMGTPLALRWLIFPLGFFVVYFLNAGIVDPLIGLMVQKRVYLFFNR